MSKIVEIYEKMRNTLNADPKVEQALFGEISKMVSSAYTQSMNSDEGYCFKFTLPINNVYKLVQYMGITQEEIFNAFRADWGLKAMTNQMHKDPYYQILLTIIYYGIKEKKKNFSENALLILLFKIWNGRKMTYLQFCDKNIMKYVVQHIASNRHGIAQYNGPLDLLKNSVSPGLLSKYHEEIERDPGKLQRIFEQSYSRINQMFVFNKQTNIQTGEKSPQGGILPMYMKAHQEGLSIKSPTISSGEDEGGPSYEEHNTAHNRDEIINSTTTYITMNPNPKYPQDFINEINDATKVSSKIIDTVLAAVHNHQYHDIIHDLIGIILSKTNVSDKTDVCGPEFVENVKKNITGSKNNADAKKLQSLCNMLLDPIFKEKIGRDVAVHSNVQQIQLRKIIISCLIYNIKKNNCKAQTAS